MKCLFAMFVAIAAVGVLPPTLHAAAPLVLGKAEHRLKVGKLLAKDDFENLAAWQVQVEDRVGDEPARVEAKDGWLDCFLPGRGATIWFKEKLKTRVAITYEVVCPEPTPAVKGISPRDINNFWLASDPGGGELFDDSRYTGKFSSYDKIHGYYASTGGGSAGDANRTIRLRRYPRKVDGRPAAHLYLNERDEQREHLIRPNEVMTVQLVAFDDLLQYIVDGKLVYEIEFGDLAQVESAAIDGGKRAFPVRYTKERFPFYREGYFGFRMVGTHHRYRKFRVHQLEAADTLTVSSIDELRQAVKLSNRRIRMKPGIHVATDLENSSNVIHFTGSHNDIDLTGVKFEVPVELLRTMRRRRGSQDAVLLLSGDHLTLTGLELENIYPNGKTVVTNFGSYNQKSELHPIRSMVEIRANGDDITLCGIRLTVRGSSPYGYGNMYGIGGGAVIGLKKHSGILAKGDRAVIDDCHVKMEAFGHAIFFQGGDDILVRNCTVIGEIRRSDDLYEERSRGDLPRRFDYELQWPEEVRGLPIPKSHMINLSEDGIRAYPGTKHVRVENCRVRGMRAGVKLYLARSAEVYDCVVTDCIVQGYSLPSRSKIVRSSGNAAYGPLLYVHSDSHNGQKIDLTVLPATDTLGDHPLAAIKGASHQIHFKAGEGAGSPVLRPIIVGYKMRFDFLSTNFPAVPAGYEKHFAKHAPGRYRAEDNVIVNDTRNPVILGELSRDNTIKSVGEVTDYGRNRK